MKAFVAASAIFAMMTASALDAAAPLLQPLPFGSATLRHYQGQPTVAIKGRNGVVEMAPLAMDHGCVNFGITVFNNSGRAADIDLSDVTIFVADAPATILTASDLQKRANSRAFWTSMAVAAVGGLSAGIANASSAHATIRTSGRHGTQVTKIRYQDGTNSANAALIGGATIAAATSVQEKGRREAAAVGDEILGLTTVDPGDAYGGRVVIDKIKADLPQTILVSVRWNGEVYSSKWQLVPAGTPAPLFAPEVETASQVSPSSLAAVPPPIRPAAIMASAPGAAPVRALKLAVVSRPKQYPHDDTVQVPM